MFAFRLFLAVNAKHGDMYNNLDWGYGAAKFGLNGFYELPKESWAHSRPNQPPGSIYLHLASVKLSTTTQSVIDWFNITVPVFPSKLVWWWQWNGDLLAIKIPSIVADFAIFAAILKLGQITKRRKAALLVGIIYLLNPALWYNSSWWGQTDAVVAALAIWSFVTLVEGRTLLSPVLLGLSLVTKASWAYVVPFYTIYYLIKFPRKLIFLLAGPAAMLAVSIPFHPHLNLPIWLVNLYTQRILGGESAFITVIAFNFWNLIYAPDFVPHTISFLGFPANIVGWAIVVVFLVVLTFRLFKNPKSVNLFWLMALLSFTVFLFAPKMTHRYLYPAFPLISIVLVYLKKAKVIWTAYAVMSVCYLVNLYYKWWAPGNLWLESFYTDANTKIISIVYLAVFALLFVLPLRYNEKV